MNLSSVSKKGDVSTVCKVTGVQTVTHEELSIRSRLYKTKLRLQELPTEPFFQIFLSNLTEKYQMGMTTKNENQ